MDKSLVNKVYEKVLGDSVVLPCPVHQKKGLYFEWSTNGYTIDDMYSSSRFKVHEETGNLKIKKLKLTDSGVYVCYAINGFGFVAGYVELHVMTLEGKRMKDGIHENKLPSKQAGPGASGIRKSSKIRASYKPIPIHPRIEEENFAFTGEDISLKFTAKGIPQPKFWWYLKGQPISAKVSSGQYREETVEVDNETVQATLTLFNVTSKLAGRYSVRALNEKGLTEAVFRVDVYPIFKSQIIGDYPSNITVNSGEQFKLSCRMRSHVQPRLQWIKRTEPLFVSHSTTSEYILSPCTHGTVVTSNSGSSSSSNFNLLSPTGIHVSSSSAGAAAAAATAVSSSSSSSSAAAAAAAGALRRVSPHEVSSIISSNTITLRPQSVLSPSSPAASASTSVTLGDCSGSSKSNRRRKPERRASRSSLIDGNTELEYIGDNVYENLLTIDKFNASHTGYYICFSYTSNEYRQIKVDIKSSHHRSAEESIDSVILLSTRDTSSSSSSSSSYSNVNSLAHGNLIAFHAVFWLIGSVIFLCCMASILFMLSIKKSLQPSPQASAAAINSVISSSKQSRGKRNQSSSSLSSPTGASTKFAEATGLHSVYKDIGIPLESMCRVPSQVSREVVSRHRNHLTQVVVESHLPPKNVNQRHCTCLRHQERGSISDSKVLSSLKSRSSESSTTKSNIYTINETGKSDHDHPWPIVRSINQVNLCHKCSMCNQSINSSPSGRSAGGHSSNYYSNERASRVSFASRTGGGGNYDSEEITVIN